MLSVEPSPRRKEIIQAQVDPVSARARIHPVGWRHEGPDETVEMARQRFRANWSLIVSIWGLNRGLQVVSF